MKVWAIGNALYVIIDQLSMASGISRSSHLPPWVFGLLSIVNAIGLLVFASTKAVEE